MLWTTAVVGLPAQRERLVAYPQDTTTYVSGGITSRGTAVPFGGFSLHGGTSLEGRWQQLVPSEYLPTTPSDVVAISVMCTDAFSPALHRRLRIAIDATNATALGPDFATNLIAPVTVFDQVDYAPPAIESTWIRVPLRTPFHHDGTRNLVLEFRKTSAFGAWCAHAQPWNPPRADLPAAQAASGPIGSGAADAGRAAFTTLPLQVRLHFAGGATLLVRSDRGSSGATFALGGTIDFDVHAPAAAVHTIFLAPGFTVPYSVPGVRGRALLVPALHLPTRSVPASEVDRQTLVIPTAPALIGTRVAAQAVVLEGVGRTPLLTDGVDFTISSN